MKLRHIDFELVGVVEQPCPSARGGREVRKMSSFFDSLGRTAAVLPLLVDRRSPLSCKYNLNQGSLLNQTPMILQFIKKDQNPNFQAFSPRRIVSTARASTET
jgi:hypothetical protein